MNCIVTKIESVRPHGENLSIVRTVEGNEVIANKLEDGSFRWAADEVCVYVPEGAILPDNLMKQRGYWDTEKDRGLLDGGKRNRVKMKKLAGFESRGLLFKVNDLADGRHVITNYFFGDGSAPELKVRVVNVGDDVTDFFGIAMFRE